MDQCGHEPIKTFEFIDSAAASYLQKPSTSGSPAHLLVLEVQEDPSRLSDQEYHEDLEFLVEDKSTCKPQGVMHDCTFM